MGVDVVEVEAPGSHQRHHSARQAPARPLRARPSHDGHEGSRRPHRASEGRGQGLRQGRWPCRVEDHRSIRAIDSLRAHYALMGEHWWSVEEVWNGGDLKVANEEEAVAG